MSLSKRASTGGNVPIPAVSAVQAAAEAGAFFSVPELVEPDLEVSLRVRAAAIGSFDSLGPPDMVHVRKHFAGNKKGAPSVSATTANSQMYGSYHFVSGIDMSTPAAPAAYFTGLLNDQMRAKNQWRLHGGTFCCFNVFSRVDVRVSVTMPGSIEAYCLSDTGERLEMDELGWKETHLSAILRALHVTEDLSKVRVEGLRVFNPIVNETAEKVFLQYAQELYFNGYVTGTALPTTAPSHVHNHFAATVWKYFADTCRFRRAIEFYEPLATTDVEQLVFVAEAYRQLDMIPSGVSVLAKALIKNPKSWVLMEKEAELLRAQGKVSHALDVAKMAADTAPGTTQCWFAFAEAALAADRYEDVLIAINLAPMGTSEVSRLTCVPPEKRINVDDEITKSILAEREGTEILLKLPARHLLATFSDAYLLLGKLLKKLGWAKLLKRRANAFVLETEFGQKAGSKTSAPASASKSVEPEAKKSITPVNGDKPVEGNESDEAETDTSEAASAKQKAGADEEPLEPIPGGKRLCERWLDGLFMALFEDLRAFLQMAQESQDAARRSEIPSRTSGDWMRLGALAERLGYKESALMGYKSGCERNSSFRGLVALMRVASEEGRINEALVAMVHLEAYIEARPNLSGLKDRGPIQTCIAKLVKTYGQKFIRERLTQENPTIARALDWTIRWQTEGYDR